MLLGEAEKKGEQLAPFALVEGGEELVFEALREAAEPTERLSSGRRDLDDLPAAIGGVATPFDQTGLLELVEQADQLALVVAESVGDRALRLTRPLVEDGQDRVVVRMQAVFLVRVEGLLLGDHPEPFEQEKWRGDELLWKALRNRLRGSVGHGKKC